MNNFSYTSNSNKSPLVESHQAEFLEILALERPRLQRLCAAIVKDAAAAEDLAQETLFEAWRNIHKLRDPEALRPWLSGIARNMCARWQRERYKQVPIFEPSDPDAMSPLEIIPVDSQIEIRLEKQERDQLLEQALMKLTPETRHILLKRFAFNQPYREIAKELGLSENGVAVRVHRGKAALRKFLQSDLRTEAASLGIIDTPDVWRETRLWCTVCGQHRMYGRLDAHEFGLRCPACNTELHSYHSQDNVSDYSWAKTFRPVLKRFKREMRQMFAEARANGSYPCRGCGEMLKLQQGTPCYAPKSLEHRRGLHLYCADCEIGSYSTIDMLVLQQQIGYDFWRQEERIRTLPEKLIEVNGVPAFLQTFESIRTTAALDLILDGQTYEILEAHTRASR